jgi:polyisoprenoid-binding protein YceI
LRRFSLFALAALLACGASAQRAGVSAVPAGATSAATTRDAPEFVIDPARSKFEVWGKDIVSGDHRINFTRWTARVKQSAEPEIHAEVEMCSAEIDMKSATRILRHDLLQCDRYPMGTLDAVMKPTGARPNEFLVEGIQELHGVRKMLRFTGFLTAEGSGDELHYRFVAAFVISRKTFDIHYGPAEPFLKDDVRVVIDVVAVPAPRAATEPVDAGADAD